MKMLPETLTGASVDDVGLANWTSRIWIPDEFLKADKDAAGVDMRTGRLSGGDKSPCALLDAVFVALLALRGADKHRCISVSQRIVCIFIFLRFFVTTLRG